jgi:hypothetical protein
MPPPDKVLAKVKQAIECVKTTNGRVGHTVFLQECDDVMVVGDLHGNVPNFQAIWKIADLANHPRRHLVLQELVHGKFTYPTGGEKSHQVVDLFCMAKTQFPHRVHYLPGNHEMAQWTGRKILKGDDDQNEQFRLGVISAYGKDLMPEIYRSYLELFQVCPLALRTPNHVFISHTIIPARHFAGFQPLKLQEETFEDTDLQPGGYAYGMVWGRDTSEDHVASFLHRVESELLVCGHVPADNGFTVPNKFQITLDCSASPGGYVLFPANEPITHDDLVVRIGTV